MRDYKKSLLILILISSLIRGFFAGFLELGNDEVYYWTYALYPDLSHFDHPPMVGWLIQIFSLNLGLDHEFFLRLSSVILGGLNTWLIYLIGRSMHSSRTGWYAALLYTGSIYSFLIAGVFILPDTPQLFYWLISTYFLMEAFEKSKPLPFRNMQLLFAGVSIGLAMLSKYTSVFLWFGAVAYVLFYDRQWLKSTYFYISILVSVAFFFPVLWWNFSNDFISFTYQSGRVGLLQSGINWNTFLTEIAGQVLYNNPWNVVLLVLALISLYRAGLPIKKPVRRILLLTSLPLIILFLVFSLFRQTLPHWTGPAYTSLILITATWLSNRVGSGREGSYLPFSIIPSISVILLVLILGTGQIKGGWLLYDTSEDPKTLGRNDISLDMYGWRQAGDYFEKFIEKADQNGKRKPDDVILSYRWFPAAHIDYYLANPNNMEVLCIGSLDQIHKYAWINGIRGGIRIGQDAWFITTSRDYADVYHLYGEYFSSIIPMDTIRITRAGKHIENMFIYKMNDLTRIPEPEF